MAFGEIFLAGYSRVVQSGKDGSILPARVANHVANHVARFGSSCPCTMQMSYSYAPDLPFKNFCKLAKQAETIKNRFWL